MNGITILDTARVARWLPGVAFLSFFLLTVGLFFWGPWEYPLGDGRGGFVAFLVAVNVAFIVGYWWGSRGAPRPANFPIRASTLVLLSSMAELALLFPTSAVNTGSWIPRPGAAMANLAAAYTGSLSIRELGRPYANYARMLLAPLLALGVPLGVYYWRQLSWGTRLLFAASVAGTIALFVAMGANAGAAHWMALFPWFVLAAHLAGVNRLSAKGWAGALSVEVVSVLFFALLFTATMNQRSGSFAKYGALPGIGAELARPAAPVAGPGRAARVAPPASRSRLRIGFDGLAGYLTQGYFAVYLSMQEPFVPGYGVGNSVFLQRQAARLLGDQRVLGRSYPDRIQARGWNAYGYWATIYPWIASDVTFPGTVVVMGLIGWLTGLVWIDVLGGRNPIAVALFGQLLVLLYYVPAHNKIMHSGEGVLAFGALLLVWVVTRVRGRAGAASA